MILFIQHKEVWKSALCDRVASVASRDTSGTSRLVENMAEEGGRKWDRCLADTAVKTG